VILEAMAAGLPVVASRVAGIPSVIRDGENGLIVPPADGRTLGEAVARLAEDAVLRERCLAGGYATARAHTREQQAASLVTLVARELRPRRASGFGRISIPLVNLSLSGGVKSLLLLANRLAERGHLVRILIPSYAAHPPVDLHPEVTLERVPVSEGPLRTPRYLLALARRAAADADVVLANYYLTAYPALLSWLIHGCRARLAYNVRGYEPLSHGLMAPAGRLGRYVRFGLAWLTYRLPFTKLVTTDWLKRMVGDRHAIVVGHGIDLEQFSAAGREPAEQDKPVTVGVIGRFGDVKGYADFLRATELLDRSLPIEYLVVRADPVPVPSGGPTEAISAPGEAEMASFYRRCDVFVFPSLAEGFGLPALEAMACGCALLTTDCGGVSTFARAEQNCLMVPPGQPEQLARALERLIADSELRRRLAAAGVETAAELDRRKSLDRLADELLLLSRRPARAPRAGAAPAR
jgi:glycosyltransferase involved in cell wall biosynthesis